MTAETRGPAIGARATGLELKTYLSARQQRYLAIRRPLEIVAAAILGFFCLPLLAILAVAIKVESPGSVFFKQKRVGRNGQVITIRKLRTMQVDAPAYSYKLPSSHPYVTRVGRFLRRSGLDEIPQFWSVIRGDLSLIGPRPEMGFIVAEYEDWHHERHLVRPGITGWWQVNNRSEEPMHLAIAYDFYYLSRLGPRLDAEILARTLAVMVSGALQYLKPRESRRQDL